MAKSHRQSFKSNETRVKSLFSLVHANVWGPAPVIGDHGFKYFLLFVDDCSRMTWVYFLKNKSEVYEKFVLFYKLIQTQFQTQIKVLRSDNGREFVNREMSNFFKDKGLVHQTSCPYTPEQNGVAERKNRIILEITRALFFDSKVPKFLWPEAVATSVYLVNRLPTKILNMKTPLQLLSSLAKVPEPLTLPLKVFGCSVYVHVPKHERTKFSACAIKCVFLGYGINQKGYRCFDPSSRKIITTMNCNFLECEYYYTSLSGQGDSRTVDRSSGPLSWFMPLPSNFAVEPTETSTAEPVLSAAEPPQSSSPDSPPLVISEVIPETIINSTIVRNDSATEPEENVVIDGDTGQFILPN